MARAPMTKAGDLVLDRYRIVDQIASGGHSVVFLGTDERLQRPVCIKVFSGLGGESGIGRTSYDHFVQEAFALSRLTHPNTLRIFDFGHLGTTDHTGMPLQVCEYMNGGTLSQVIRDHGPQSIAEMASLVGAMCAALGEAHALGIVHRDIKPQNILYGSVGGVRLPKLADFGIAKWSADDDASSQRAEDTQVIAGQKLAMYSPSWAAPEQLAGQPVSPATDIYSLAALAVFMLSSKAIFADEDVYAGYRKRKHAEPLVREAVKLYGVPEQVIHVLAKALAFDPKQRPVTVESFIADLQAAVVPSAPTPRMPTPLRGSPPLAQVAATAAAITEVPPPRPPSAAFDAVTTSLGPPEPAAPLPPPPIAPPQPPNPGAWTQSAVVAPWMTVAPSSSGPAHRVALADPGPVIADRRVTFAMLANAPVELSGAGAGQKIRVSIVPRPSGPIFHIKGASCFVALLGGRPSPAVQLERSADISLVTPRAQEIGHVRVVMPQAANGETVFSLGAGHVAISVDDCADPILFDFGPGSSAYFVYTRGRAVPRPRR